MGVRVSRSAWIFWIALLMTGAWTAWRSGKTAWELAMEMRPWCVILASAGMHELGHGVAAWGAGVRVKGLRVDLLGARICLEGLLSYGQEWLVAAGGPVASGLAAALVLPLWASHGYPAEGMLCLFVGASVALGGLNLLPVGTLDGGRMLYCALASAVGERFGLAVLRVTGGACVLALWLFSVYALLRVGEMVAPFAFSLVLLARILRGDPRE